MKKKDMFTRILAKSLLNRRARIAVAVLAITLGASLVSALTSVSLDARGKAGKELRSYGANIYLVPRSASLQVGMGGLDFGAVSEQSFIPEESLAALRSGEVVPHVAGFVPYIYGVVEVEQQRVVLTGTSFGDVRQVSPWWQVTGRWPEDGAASSAIVGSEVARKLGLEIGSAFAAGYNGRSLPLTVEGIVDTGAAEDGRVFVDLRVAQELLDRRGLIEVVEVSATTAKQPVGATAAQIEKAVPQVQARVIGQIADSELAVLGKVELLLAIVAVLVLLSAALSAASTMTTTVLERTKEIGLLKALGASKKRIALLFVAEAGAIGAFGGILGYIAGFVIAQLIGRSVFESTISFNLLVLPLCLIVGLGIATLASVIPVRSAVEIDPAITLRGE